MSSQLARGDPPPRLPAAQAEEAVPEEGQGGVQPADAGPRHGAAGRHVGPGPQQEGGRQEGAGERLAPQCGPGLSLLPGRAAPAPGLSRALDQEEVSSWSALAAGL